MAWMDRVQLRGAAHSATATARTGHDRQHTGRDRPDRPPARRNAIRAVSVPRLPGLPARSPARQAGVHSHVLQGAVAGRMQGRSRNGVPPAHEALRDSALTCFRIPGETFRGLPDNYRLLLARRIGFGSGTGWRHHPKSRVSQAGIAANAARSLSVHQGVRLRSSPAAPQPRSGRACLDGHTHNRGAGRERAYHRARQAALRRRGHGGGPATPAP